MPIFFNKTMPFVGKIYWSFIVGVIFSGFYGYSKVCFFPFKWFIVATFLISLPIGMLLVWRYKYNNPNLRKMKSIKLAAFYLAMPPVIVFMLWTTCLYTIPSGIFPFYGTTYMNRHVVYKKEVNCSLFGCHFCIKINDIAPFLKGGKIEVKKDLYEKINVNDIVVVKGKLNVLGIKVDKISRVDVY
jgi:hypothetical protein